MEWWRKAVVVPARRAFVAVAARLRRNKNKEDGLTGLMKLREDVQPCSDGLSTGLMMLREEVQSCGYEDVLVMWEMLHKSEPPEPPKPPPKAPKGLFWRCRLLRFRRC